MGSNNIYREILAVSNRHLCSRPFLDQIEAVCRRKPRALVLREKDLFEEEYEKLARLVLPVCEAFRVPCILHSFAGTAKKLHVDTIHLPLLSFQEQPWLKQEFSVIGTSVHTVQEAQKAEKLGAGYIIAGHIFQTGCKPGVPPRGLEFLEEVCGAVSIPVYAIGGMQLTGSCLKEIKERGAAGMCVMSGLMKGEDR